VPKKPRRPRDPASLAFDVFQEAIGEKPKQDPDAGKNQKFAALGSAGGKKGGKARAASLSAKERSAAARKAARARWKRAKT
jgi:hypothetical protein